VIKAPGRFWHRWQDNIKIYTKKQGVSYRLDSPISGLRSMAWSSVIGNELFVPPPPPNKKTSKISLLATQMLASQQGLCRIELVGR